jgi:hypothetical protein
MYLSSREQRLLNRISEAESQTDPGLASILEAFGWLTAGEAMPESEQLEMPAGRIKGSDPDGQHRDRACYRTQRGLSFRTTPIVRLPFAVTFHTRLPEQSIVGWGAKPPACRRVSASQPGTSLVHSPFMTIRVV